MRSCQYFDGFQSQNWVQRVGQNCSDVATDQIVTNFLMSSMCTPNLPSVAFAMKVLQACNYKSVNTGLFFKSLESTNLLCLCFLNFLIQNTLAENHKHYECYNTCGHKWFKKLPCICSLLSKTFIASATSRLQLASDFVSPWRKPCYSGCQNTWPLNLPWWMNVVTDHWTIIKRKAKSLL